LNRTDHVEKAIKFIDLFKRNEFVTASMVMQTLGVCRTNAHRWIKSASLVMPIYEAGEISTGGRGRSEIRYAIL
jgi:hypothetical protein